MKDVNDRARLYREKFNVKPGDRMVGLPVGAHDDAMRKSYEAHVQLAWYEHFRTLTNFPYFYFRAQVEMDPRAVEVRKNLFEAEQLRKSGDRQLAMNKYQEAFPKWRELMLEHPGFSADDVQQEDIYEYVLRYLDLAHETYGNPIKQLLVFPDYLMQRGNRSPLPVMWAPPGFLTPQVRANITTAMDGNDSQGQLLIGLVARMTVRDRLHLPQVSGTVPEHLTPAGPPKMPSLVPADGQPGGKSNR